MTRAAIALVILAVTACAPQQQPSPSKAPSPTAEPTPSADPVALVCDAIDIVTDEISPAYEAIGDGEDPGLQGLAIANAGSDIADLAEQASDPDIADALRELGEGYVDEGLLVTEGDLTGSPPTDVYFQLIDDYGQAC